MAAVEADLLGVAAFPVRHGFSTRALGSMGLSGAVDPGSVLARRERFAQALGFDLTRAVLAGQIHGSRVLTLRRRDGVQGAQSVLGTDALASDVAGQALLTYHADCYPILFSDPSVGVVALAHVGWRGALEGLPSETVSALVAAYGSRPADLRVLIGPGICQSCYPVGPEVADQFVARFGSGDAYLVRDGSWAHLDIARLTQLQLWDRGVPPSNILSSGWCTREDERWFSHRAGRSGRFLAAIVTP